MAEQHSTAGHASPKPVIGLNGAGTTFATIERLAAMGLDCGEDLDEAGVLFDAIMKLARAGAQEFD